MAHQINNRKNINSAKKIIKIGKFYYFFSAYILRGVMEITTNIAYFKESLKKKWKKIILYILKNMFLI